MEELKPMLEENRSLETRLEQLQSEIRLLHDRVDELTLIVQRQAPMLRTFVRTASPEANAERDTPDLLHNQSVSTVLSSVATVSFLLVVALVLRSIVDSGAIDRTLGSMIGMGYAGLLIAYGFYRFSKSKSNIPVYSTCGTLLLFSIVFESYSRFHSLSAGTAYGVLVSILVVMTVMGIRFDLLTPLFVGICGSVVVGFSLGFPNLHFVLAAGLCFLGNLAALRSSKVHGTEPIRTILLLLTLLFFVLWTTKIRSVSPNEVVPAAGLSLFVLSAMVVLFFLMFLIHNLSRAVAFPSGFSIFEWNLVVVAALGVYLLYRSVSERFGIAPGTLGALGVGLGLLHLVLAVFLGFRKEGGREAVTPFVLAALVLFGWSLATATSHLSFAVLGWSSIALAVSLMGASWDNTRVLFFAALVQLAGCGLIAYSRMLGVFAPIGTVQTAILCGLAGLALAHYVVGRRNIHRLSDNEWLSPDSVGHSLVLVLAAGCVYSFAVLRKGLFQLVAALPSLPEESFSAGQSILINAMALVLMWVGLKAHNGQIVGMGFLAAGAGAAKVFGYDFWNISGVPNVLGVLSFGITAGLGSLVWKRWQQEINRAEDALPQTKPVSCGDGPSAA